MMSFEEEEVLINGKFTIGATVSCADREGRHPAIILIGGTGNLDRDGNSKMVKLNFYKDLASMFAEWGYAVIRYDKRGLYKSGGDFGTVGLIDLVDDAISVIQYAKSLPYVDPDKVIVCGHSEGAIIATILAGRERTAGLMLLGCAATSLKDSLYYQNRLLSEQSKDTKGFKGMILRKTADEDKSIARVDELFSRCSNTEKEKVFFKGVRMDAKWLREHDEHTSEILIAMLRDYEGRILAIIGDKDLSSDYRRLDLIRDLPNVECYAPAGVNHILREIDDDNSMLNVKKQYTRLSVRPVHEGTKERMKGWLASI